MILNILHLNKSTHLGGDTKCVLKLCKKMKEDNNIYMASSGGILLEEFEKMKIDHYLIKNVVNKSPYVIIFNVIKLIKLVKSKKIDVIHSHHRMATLTAKIVRKFTGVNVVHTQHSCVEDKVKLTKIALSNIELVTVSDAVKNRLVNKYKLDEKRMTTVYNTIDLTYESKEVDDCLIKLKNDGYFIVAQVSRINKYKGIYEFVDIAKATIKKNKNIRFIFLGDGPEKQKMMEYIKEQGMSEYIYLLGAKSNVIEHIKYIDLMLLCSFVEGLPLTPLEAFSQKVPVIGTDIDGTREEIENGVNGYLINISEIDEFANKIDKISRDKKLFNILRENSLSIFEEKFNEKNYIEGYKNVYFNMLRGKKNDTYIKRL